MARRLASIGLLPVLALTTPAAQEVPELDLILDRLARYLTAYQRQLAGVVADERYDQQEILVLRRTRSVGENVRDRKLESEIAFLLGPGEPLWIGVRDVRRVDGRSLRTNTMRLDDLIQSTDQRRRAEEVGRIVAASAEHNLGGARTTNLPTTPLELLQADNLVRFIFKAKGKDKIDGTTTTKLDFEEFDEPTLIKSLEGDPLFVRGSAWVEPESGTLWRVQLEIRPLPKAGRPPNIGNRLRVDFMRHAGLEIMVPKELTEDFFVLGGRGNGRASYSNHRRFIPVKAPPQR
jgi:hypothetical protein